MFDEHDLRMWKSHGKEWEEELKNERCFAKFLCGGCGKQKVDSDFLRKKFPRDMVETSVDLRYDGLTLEKTRKNASKIHKKTVKSATTIYNWTKNYARKFVGVIKGLGERLHADETLVETFQKGKFIYFWALKCPETKAIVGWHVSENRDEENAKLFFWECRRHFEVSYFPEAIRTDKLASYPFAIAKVFNHEVKHEKQISFAHGNNVIECFWRCKRTFPKFRTIESARKYIAHYVAEYNSEKLLNLSLSIIRRMNATLARLVVFYSEFGYNTPQLAASLANLELWNSKIIPRSLLRLG